MATPYISVVIPTINEEHNMKALLEGIKTVLKGYSYEVIVVDGNKNGPSTDRTEEIAKKHKARVIHDYNGKGSALITGFRAAHGEIIISMDADLSHRPKELKLLISGIETGYDICVGSRFLTGGGTSDMPMLRKLGNKFFVWLVNFLYGSTYTDMCYGYRSFSKKALRTLRLSEKGFGIETEVNIKAQKADLSILEVPSFEKKRASGTGNLRSFQDGLVILRTIIRNFNG